MISPLGFPSGFLSMGALGRCSSWLQRERWGLSHPTESIWHEPGLVPSEPMREVCGKGGEGKGWSWPSQATESSSVLALWGDGS